jgi:carotenoid cleavage dioxygenase-like enzyme
VTQGAIPDTPRGTYYRVGADPAWPSAVPGDFFFNADSMVSMFRSGNGYVDFRCRYVRTPWFLAERAARRSLSGAYRNPYTDPAAAGISRGLANANLSWHAGRLLASKEDSPPVQIDPDTLDTVGEWTRNGDLASQTATAHRRSIRAPASWCYSGSPRRARPPRTSPITRPAAAGGSSTRPGSRRPIRA